MESGLSVLTDRVKNNGEQRCCYKLFQWKNKGLFDIFNAITDYVILVQLKDYAININHTVSITGC